MADEALAAELPDDVDVMTLAEVAAVMDEERAQEPPADVIDLDADDPALVVFTSGTTGEPRGVVHAQRYLTGQRLQATRWLGARDGELAWCTTATGWSKSARNVFVAPWLRGAAVVHAARSCERSSSFRTASRRTRSPRRVCVLCRLCIDRSRRGPSWCERSVTAPRCAGRDRAQPNRRPTVEHRDEQPTAI